MSYERPLLATLRAALSRPTPVVHVLIGPRQVGKTTIARQIHHTEMTKEQAKQWLRPLMADKNKFLCLGIFGFVLKGRRDTRHK